MENEVLVATERSGMPLWVKGVIAAGTLGLGVAAFFGIKAYRKHRSAKKVAEPEAHE